LRARVWHNGQRYAVGEPFLFKKLVEVRELWANFQIFSFLYVAMLNSRVGCFFFIDVEFDVECWVWRFTSLY